MRTADFSGGGAGAVHEASKAYYAEDGEPGKTMQVKSEITCWLLDEMWSICKKL